RALVRNYCSMCLAPRLLRSLISDEDNTPHPRLLALERYLLRDKSNADTVVSWIRRSPIARLVHDMATHRTPISLPAVAQHPATGATGYLAAALMESGVVPTEELYRMRPKV